MTVAIRLEEQMEKRLENLAIKTGRTKSFYVKLALSEFLESQEANLLENQNINILQKVPVYAGSVPQDRIDSLEKSISSKQEHKLIKVNVHSKNKK